MSEALPSVYEFDSNIGDAEAPKPLPAAEYRASVRTAEFATSKTSGKTMLVLTYVVSPDQYPVDFKDGNPDGEVGKVYKPLDNEPRTKYMMRKFCEMHGVAPSARISPAEFMGQEVMVKIEHEDYQGMPQARFNPVRAV